MNISTDLDDASWMSYLISSPESQARTQISDTHCVSKVIVDTEEGSTISLPF